MKTIKFVYWQDGTFWLGYLQDYPDFMTQGETLEELQENLKDIYNESMDNLKLRSDIRQFNYLNPDRKGVF